MGTGCDREDVCCVCQSAEVCQIWGQAVTGRMSAVCASQLRSARSGDRL